MRERALQNFVLPGASAAPILLIGRSAAFVNATSSFFVDQVQKLCLLGKQVNRTAPFECLGFVPVVAGPRSKLELLFCNGIGGMTHSHFSTS
jgi:hypothetical protein